MLYTILQQGQTQRKQHLSETLSYVSAKHSALIDSIKQEEALNKTLNRVQEALKAKDAAISMTDSGSREIDSSSGAAITDLKTKMKEVKEANKHFQNQMKELLLAFPSPTGNVQQRKSSKSALDNTRDFDEDNFISLSSIIGQLIEQALNSPGQPYIDISDRMWQQHIEFLLRSQIILKDPESSTRIKLVPFHL